MLLLEKGEEGIHAVKNIPFPGISYPQTLLQAILQIYVYQSLVSSPNARNTLPWIVGKPVKLRSYFLVPMKSFPGFPSIFSTITITRAVAWPESGAPQTLPLMKISTQHFKLFTFLETILHTKYFLNYFIMKGTSVITCAEIVAEYFESSAVCEFPHCCVSNSGPRPSSRWLYFLQGNKSKPSTVLSLVGWSD